MNRFSLSVGVFLLLIKDQKVLLLRRKNTGWGDGNYDLIAGHLDGNEAPIQALLRESQEEIGVSFDPSAAHFTHLTHCLGNREYLYITFIVTDWTGEPRNLEPEKHDDLQWFALSDLPENLTPGTKTVLEAYKMNRLYSEIEA